MIDITMKFLLLLVFLSFVPPVFYSFNKVKCKSYKHLFLMYTEYPLHKITEKGPYVIDDLI